MAEKVQQNLNYLAMCGNGSAVMGKTQPKQLVVAIFQVQSGRPDLSLYLQPPMDMAAEELEILVLVIIAWHLDDGGQRSLAHFRAQGAA